MVETLSNDVLRRKARAGREEHQSRVMSPARAMRLALSRAADDLFGLAISVSGVQCEQLGQDSMLRTVDDEMLLVVLDGPRGAVGAVAVDLSVLAGLIEQQTMGRVLNSAPDVRVPTDTDAALIAPLVDMLLEGIAANLGEEDGALTAEFQFGARIETKRHLSLIVEAPDFHVLRAQLELDGGAKRGEFVLIAPVQLPELAPPAAVQSSKSGAQPQSDAEEAFSKMTFAQSALMEAEACLQAVIHREKMTLGALGKLKPGDRLHLSEFALDRVVLGAGAASKLGPCKLGQHGGLRAVQLRFAVRSTIKDELREQGVEREPSEQAIVTPPKPAQEAAPATAQMPELPDLSDLPGFAPDLLSEAS